MNLKNIYKILSNNVKEQLNNKKFINENMTYTFLY